MGVVSAEKLFIDPKEEITFIVEKIKSLNNQKVILVVPQNSHLLSSNVSINILSRQLLDEDKLVTVVTEDEYGKTISDRAGFVTVEKVSEVSGESWVQAGKNKNDLKNHILERKNNLLSGIVGDKQITNYKDDQLREEQVTNEIDDDSELETTEDLRDEKQDVTRDSDDELGNDADNSEITVPDGRHAAQSTEQDEQEALEKYKKPRQEPKVVEIEGLKILAGGDVNHFNKKHNDVKIEDELNIDKMANANESFSGREIKRSNGTNTFTGKDFTKVIRPKRQFGGFNFFKRRKNLTEKGLEEPNPARSRRRKIIAGGVVASLLLIIFGVYFFVFNLSSVDVEITFKKQELNFKQKVIAAEDGETDLDTSMIPAKFYQEGNLSISRTGKADGKGKRGTTAKGFVTIYNTTESAVNIKSGTKITSVATSLKYSITKDITLPATNLDSSHETSDIGKVDDVPVESVDFGAEYNIEDSDSNTIFELEGFSGVDNVYAKRFSSFEGGKSEEFIAVSKENIENLKKQILPDLEKQGKSKIEAFVTNDYVLITDSIKFEETKVSSNPSEGEEAKDGSFSLTVEGKISAFAVKEMDLQSIVEKYLADDDENLSLELETVGNYIFQDVVRDEKRVSFTLSLEGKTKQTLADDIIFENIKGKKLQDAKTTLRALEQVESAKISFTPGFIPESWKFVPKDESRINIISQ